jgi:GNAT superfamily N-acetyltransferase
LVVVRMHIVTLEDRPGLLAHSIPRREGWPEYNLHGDVISIRWVRLCDDLPEYQLFALSDEGEVVGESNAAPCWWDGVPAHLPDGIDAALTDALDCLDTGRTVNTLCTLATLVTPAARGAGLSRLMLEAMSELARRHGFGHVVAPVRPSLKERYPLTPIERYATWRRPDGLLFDPWMRTHERLGAVVGPPLPYSLRITGSVAEWESWTGMVFPDPGRYVIPHGLAVVQIDRGRDLGRYWEPNVWMITDL